MASFAWYSASRSSFLLRDQVSLRVTGDDEAAVAVLGGRGGGTRLYGGGWVDGGDDGERWESLRFWARE